MKRAAAALAFLIAAGLPGAECPLVDTRMNTTSQVLTADALRLASCTALGRNGAYELCTLTPRPGITQIQQNGKVDGTIPLGGHTPYGIAVGPSRTDILTLNTATNLWEVGTVATDRISGSEFAGASDKLFSFRTLANPRACDGGCLIGQDFSENTYVVERGISTIEIFPKTATTSRVIPTPTPNAAPDGFTLTPDGRVFFIYTNFPKLLVIDPQQNFKASEVPAIAYQSGQKTTSCRNALWGANASSVGEYSPDLTSKRSFSLPTTGALGGIECAPNGNIFLAQGSTLIRLVPESGCFSSSTIPGPPLVEFLVAPGLPLHGLAVGYNGSTTQVNLFTTDVAVPLSRQATPFREENFSLRFKF